MRTVCLLFICLPWRLLSQPENLVLNPGFEIEKSGSRYPACSYAANQQMFDEALEGWQTYGGMTPDYVIWEGNEFGDCFFPKPHSGNRAVGFISYLPAVDLGRIYDYHEYIRGQLRFPLEPGKPYRVEWFIQQADAIAVDHLQILYGEKQDIIPVSAGNLGICFLYNDPRWLPKESFKPQVVFRDPIVTGSGEWKHLQATFVPDRAYLFFVIGNFYKDEHTRTSQGDPESVSAFNREQAGFSEKKKRIGYYLIDDIRVTQTEMPSAKTAITETLIEKRIYTFKNVHFETAKWDLLPPALPELSALAEYLLENPDLIAEIAGHTDNIGSEADNNILSENRAKSVCQYLIFKGVPEERIIYTGYGESQPVESNETDWGRAANRRVECRLR